MTYDIKAIEKEYLELRKKGLNPIKQAELNGILYGYKLGYRDAKNIEEKHGR